MSLNVPGWEKWTDKKKQDTIKQYRQTLWENKGKNEAYCKLVRQAIKELGGKLDEI